MVKETPECWRNWEVDYGILVAHFWPTKSYLYKVGGSYFEYFWPISENVQQIHWGAHFSFCVTSHWSILRMFITIWKWRANLALLQINWSVHLVLTIELSGPMNSQQPWLPKLSTSRSFRHQLQFGDGWSATLFSMLRGLLKNRQLGTVRSWIQ